MDMMPMAMGFGWGAAAGVIITAVAGMNFMVLPAIILGGGIGAAFMGGFINI